jgi:hypothetical protein
MAKVAGTTEKRLDLLLDSSSDAYEELPEVAAEIKGWNDGERMGYVYDWFLVEERLKELERDATKMNSDQRRRYDRLKELIKKNEEHAELIKTLVV